MKMVFDEEHTHTSDWRYLGRRLYGGTFPFTSLIGIAEVSVDIRTFS